MTEENPAPTQIERVERRPWNPPVLTVAVVSEITRSGTTSSQNDGATVFSPLS